MNFIQRGIIWRETAGKFKENGQKQGNLSLCKLGVVNFKREYWPALRGIEIFAVP